MIRTFTYPERRRLPRWDNYLRPGLPPEFDPAMVTQVAVFAPAMWTQTTTYEDGSFDVLGRLCSWSRTFDGEDDGAAPIRLRRDHWGL